MKLFRGRLGFPRWSFTDGITKPRRVAERDPHLVDDTDAETTQLPRFAIAHISAGGARSALTPTDPARRYGIAHDVTSSQMYGAEATDAIRSMPARAIAIDEIVTPVSAYDIEEIVVAPSTLAVAVPEAVEPHAVVPHAVEPEVVAPQVVVPEVVELQAVKPEVAPQAHASEVEHQAIDLVEIENLIAPATALERGDSAYVDDDQVDFIARQRTWMENQGDWPTEPTEDAVISAGSDHPDRVLPERPYRGLPADLPVVVRARNGRGFGGLSLVSRRRRRVKPRPPLDLDMLRLDEVMSETRASVGAALVDLTIFETKTGLPVATEGGTGAATAMWHRAGKELTASLQYADLPRLGSYYLVRLAGGRAAVVVNAHEDLGACLTLDLDQIGLGTVLTQTVPAVQTAIASMVREA